MRTKRQVVEKIVFYFRDNYDNIVNVTGRSFRKEYAPLRRLRIMLFWSMHCIRRAGTEAVFCMA